MAAQTQPQQQSLNMQDFLTIFFKHKWKILITFALVAAATCVIALQTTPKQFVAKGVVMVKFGREFVPVSEVGNVQPPTMNPESIINTEVQILTGRDLMEKVVDAVGPEELYPELGEKPLPPDWRREIAILNFRTNLLVNPVKGSNLIEVYFRSKDPRVTAQVVNTLVDKLQERHLQVFSDPKSSFLEAQTKEYQEKLSKSEADIENFKQKNQVFSLDEQRSLLLHERDESEATLKTEQVRSRELQEKISFLKDRKNVYTDGVLEQLRSNLNGLEQKEQELASKYNDDNLTLVNHRKEMQVVREQIAKHEEEVRAAEMTKIQAELEPLLVKVAGLQQRYDEAARKLRQIDGLSRQFEDLKREAATNESNYQTYLKKTEEARISEDLDRRKMTNVSVLERASVPITPIESKRQKTFGIGAFLAVALSLGLAYAAEYLPRGMTTPQSAVRRLSLPLMVTVPRHRRNGHAPDMEDEMITLYQTITSALPDTEHRSVLFVGSRSNEGTSTISRKLASTVSLRLEKNVLLIDLDRSRPDLHIYPNLKQEKTVDEIAKGDGEIGQALCQVEESSLYVMPLFEEVVVTPRTLEFARDERFWEPLRERFDLIIVDSPPVTMFPDGLRMVSKADGVVLVVEAEKTRWPAALSVKERIKQSGGKVLGIAFNKRQYYIPGWLYRRI